MGKDQTSRDSPRRPLLVIDGDSFAHRSYHALPKTILRRGRKPAGAILGFANMLLRLYREEEPPCWSPGTRSRFRPTGMRSFQPTKAVETSTTPCLNNLTCCRNLLPHVAFRTRK